MYTIIADNDNNLIASVKKRIMQRSKLVDSMHFLVPKMYEEFDLTEFTCQLEYILPVSKVYKSEILTPAEELYNEEYIEYLIPMDTSLTSEAGNIDVQLTFVKSDLDEAGNSIQYVRKTSTCTITIIPIAKWSDIIPDSALNAIDQKLIAVDARIKQLADMEAALSTDKADNIILDESYLQLTSNGTPIGDKIDLKDLGDDIVDATESEGIVKIII